MNFYERALELQEETVTHRRWLHSNAEVGLHMPKGQNYVMEQLRESGLDPHPCGHGVTAELGREGGRTLLPTIRKFGLMRMSVRSVLPVWRTVRSAG